MVSIKKIRFGVVAVSLAAAALTGCQSYRIGFTSHPDVDSVAVGTFENRTTEAALATVLRAKISEAVMRDGGIKLARKGQAESLLRGKVVGVRSRRVAAVKRDENEAGDYQSDYRSAVYRAYVVVKFELVSMANPGDVLMPEGTVTGEADYPNTPDLSVARDEAVKQAAADAARQIAAAVTEAW